MSSSRRRHRPALSRPTPTAATTTSPAASLPAAPRPHRRPSRWRAVVSKRRMVQATVGLALFWATGQGLPLSWVIVGGSVAGILLGKFFCRWMCPMGAMMELITGAGGDKHQSLYMYFKVGCPIAWAGGLLNRVSLLRVKLRPERCTDCGQCDKACYVSQLATGRSLHVAGQVNASTDYTCSRCLACVGACATGALTVGLAGRRELARPRAAAPATTA